MPLQQALRHLDKAFRNFFEGRAKYPSFHKKHGRQAATYASSAFRWDAATRTLTLAKMDAPLAIHWSRSFTGTPTTVTVSQTPPGATSSPSWWRKKSPRCRSSTRWWAWMWG